MTVARIQFQDQVQQDLVIYRGDDLIFDFPPLTYVDGTVVDLTDFTFSAVVKNSPDSTITLGTFDVWVIGDATEGRIEVQLAGSITQALEFTGGDTGVYDVDIYNPDLGVNHTPYYGVVSFKEDVSPTPS
jgi:hypothetical protein